MGDERAWDYCAICGRKIPVGEMCYGVKRNAALLFSGDTICKDCIAPENYELAPAADVRPVVRGRWEPGNPICPICGESKFKGLDADIWADWMPPHCPNCGADMRGVDSDE